jgi:hypothetical protein
VSAHARAYVRSMRLLRRLEDVSVSGTLLSARAEVQGIADVLGMPVDEGIAETVACLRALGFRTSASCEGHLDWGEALPWVRFDLRFTPAQWRRYVAASEGATAGELAALLEEVRTPEELRRLERVRADLDELIAHFAETADAWTLAVRSHPFGVELVFVSPPTRLRLLRLIRLRRARRVLERFGRFPRCASRSASGLAARGSSGTKTRSCLTDELHAAAHA